MFASIIIITALATLTTALPTTSNKVEARAGGPVAKPIPSTCTVNGPLPTGESHVPSPSTSNALLYYAYYPSPSTNKTQMSQQCLEQCYGYGDSTQCKTAYWAENMVVPAGYCGSPGGNLETGCLMFNRTLTSAEFIPSTPGQNTSPFAGNIQC
ncbi:hypothetical protein K469DRAFT_692693 [Zopfia rhizophila CBS 207.26]|uniref:Apple domain-containing protein n=1 Tax=Zopfia rhizophila CBS 207.26 TaxID=1314779 RepID=A0A6A6DQI2_9PEZI|nr:hypothetical protein K469DRAFT_692693 [Zopfia rhizophila CBS 207.26]